MNIGLLNLTFDDVVNISTFDPQAFRIQNALRATGDRYYTLQSSTTSSSAGYDIVVDFSDEDFFGVKRVAGLARDRSTSWLTMQAFAIDDLEGVDVLAITDGKAIQVTNYVTDDVPPEVVSFTLDIDSGRLNLTLNDFTDSTTLLVSAIGIQNGTLVTDPDAMFQLTGGR